MATTNDHATDGTSTATPGAATAGPDRALVENSHVVMTPGTCGGKPRIAGTRIRVRDVVEWTDQGQTPDEIVAAFPRLSLGDVHGALAFYHDNREFVDRLIREDDEDVEKMMRERPPGLLKRLGFDPDAPEREGISKVSAAEKGGS
jgi:uncharacterized protein (DUF433 family)